MNPPKQSAAIPGDATAAPPEETSSVVALHADGSQPARTALLPLMAESPQFRWNTSLVANQGAGPNARLRARPWLTVGHWPGNVDQAARVADKLVDNAVTHGKAFPDGCIALRMIVLAGTDELLIEVDDALPDFPNFEQAAALTGEIKGQPTGLWWVAHYRGRLYWDTKKSADDVVVGKTVQAILPPNWGVPE
ncbi:hypothetical protein [Streptomyces sp. NBC_00268]|uniref:hypothetical protein n=1 Tax=Streptomyces sp. NBC_00268 TaxID=2975695 RepID=UPI00224F2514|nr:hypothetical protein [Streptomyces sp. NBC_00268]MCX5182626.1 hypothetical protein [Streptomyces sp. NBC_00268]